MSSVRASRRSANGRRESTSPAASRRGPSSAWPRPPVLHTGPEAGSRYRASAATHLLIAESPAAYRASAPQRANSGPPESAVHDWWAAAAGREVRLAGGGSRRVVFPGWPNGGAGPDFLGAVLRDGRGRLARGDVEIHVDGADWRAHGHHRDPRYRGVILHVALKPPATPVAMSDGATAPTAVIELGGSTSGAPEEARPCMRPGPTPELAAVLEHEGLRRFEARAAAYAQYINDSGPEQALYAGVLEALGYARNVEPFRRLVELAPWPALEAALLHAPEATRVYWGEALLLGAAGLLPSQRGWEAGPGYPSLLETLWERRPAGLRSESLPWRFDGARPANAPARRAAAAGTIAARLAGGLAGRLGGLLLNEGARGLAAAFTVDGPGYWRARYDFSPPENNGRAILKREAAVVGASRAADIVVNVALPWLAAAARREGDAALAERCLDAFRTHPPLAANRLTRRMETMLRERGTAAAPRTAAVQQGMIGLYKRRCDALLCEGCALA